MTNSQTEIICEDRPKKWRLFESFLFSMVYLLSAAMLIPAVNMVMNDGVTDERFLTLMAIFAVFAMPLEVLLWYSQGSKVSHMTMWRITTIGFLSVIVPCLLMAVLTFGLAMFLWPIYLPPAIPVAVIMTWLFARIKDRLISAQSDIE